MMYLLLIASIALSIGITLLIVRTSLFQRLVKLVPIPNDDGNRWVRVTIILSVLVVLSALHWLLFKPF
jgi:hypothetical protein